jgi:uncharacterized membrane protein
VFSYTQGIAVSRGLKCVWVPVREMNRDRLVAIWIPEEIIMDTANTKPQRVQPFYWFLLLLIIGIVLFLANVIWVECLLRVLQFGVGVALVTRC